MAAVPTLIDSGPLVATYRADDEHHQLCIEAEQQLTVPLFTCWPVITETVYLIRKSPKAVASLLSRLASGDIALLPLTEDDVPGVQDVLTRFHDQKIDLADACLTHLAEREGMKHVFTLDRRHFSVLRTASNRIMTIIP
jgi:predicted nucleic acid-binding protein